MWFGEGRFSGGGEERSPRWFGCQVFHFDGHVLGSQESSGRGLDGSLEGYSRG